MVIPFSHEYYKLRDQQFTTIRGKTFGRNLHLGQIVEVKSPSNKFKATVYAVEYNILKDIPLKTLKLDGEHSTLSINSLEEFINLLNQFRTGHMPKVDENSVLSVVYLRKI